MSTHNILFNGELMKIIPELSTIPSLSLSLYNKVSLERQKRQSRQVDFFKKSSLAVYHFWRQQFPVVRQPDVHHSEETGQF